MFYTLARHALFQLSPETAHHLALDGMRIANKCGVAKLWPQPKANPLYVMGLSFPHAVGLAAGLDKNGDYIDALAALGFAFIEIGTVTPKAQAGNPQPRLFRLPKAHAIINRMGFNNHGVDYLVRNVEKSSYKGILGINIGKNAVTPVENAVDDYLICLDRVYAHADYVTVNISSPNTKGLRSLQSGDALAALLEPIKNRQQQLATQHGKYVPIAVKIAPDLELADIDVIADILTRYELDGVIATNTTISREAVQHLPHGQEQGGLSGRPVRTASTAVIKHLRQRLSTNFPIIGVGGIDDGASAVEKIQAGANLVQVYTGFIYQGPSLIKEAANAILAAKA